jgi:hypothetical protein
MQAAVSSDDDGDGPAGGELDTQAMLRVRPLLYYFSPRPRLFRRRYASGKL